MRDDWMERKFATLRKLSWVALAGILVFCLYFLPVNRDAKAAFVVVGILLAVPWFFFVVIMTIWHWKYRYRGGHSDLWGAILVVESSGWFKIVYWFRHILPDWRGTGRYAIGKSSDRDSPESTH